MKKKLHAKKITKAKKVSAKKPSVKRKPVKKTAVKKAAVKKHLNKKTPQKKAVNKIIKKVVKKSEFKSLPRPQYSTNSAPVKRAALEKKKTVLHSSDIKNFLKTLTAQRQDTLARIQAKKDEDMTIPLAGDSADQASQSVDKEIFFETSDSEHTALENIETALRKIKKGIYGMCEVCGCPISRKRLEALPSARNCVDCQSVSERKKEPEGSQTE